MPRLLNKIYDKVHDNVRGSLLKEWALRAGLEAKSRAFREGQRPCRNDTIWDRLIFHKVRESFGGRIRILATGSALLDPRVGEALRSIFGCVVRTD